MSPRTPVVSQVSSSEEQTVNLNGGHVSLKPDDLPNQLMIAHPNDQSNTKKFLLVIRNINLYLTSSYIALPDMCSAVTTGPETANTYPN